MNCINVSKRIGQKKTNAERSQVSPCGGCRKDAASVHQCPLCKVNMHPFCGTPVGQEGFGQKIICPACLRRDGSKVESDKASAISADEEEWYANDIAVDMSEPREARRRNPNQVDFKMQWALFLSRGLFYNELLFEPMEVKGDGNCLYRAVACGYAFPVDYMAFRMLVADKATCMFNNSSHDSVMQLLYNCLRPDKCNLSFLEYVDEKIRRDKQYASELDMVIISVAVNINVRCISNYRTGFQEHNSSEFLKQLKNSLTDAGVQCQKLNDAISKDAKDIWVYHHRHGLPTEPDTGDKLDHYCFLRRIPTDPVKSSIAYRCSNTGGLKAAERQREPLPQEACLPPKPKHDREKRKGK